MSRGMRPGWAPARWGWWEITDPLTPQDRAWLDRMWEPTEQPARVVDLTPDPRLARVVLR